MYEDFIGQTKIILELDSIYNDIRKTNVGVNILFRGQAGCGKTLLANMFLSSLGSNVYHLPDRKHNYEFIWNEKISSYRYHFVDEVHKLKYPEVMYPILDSGNYVFVFASNEYGELPEALFTRCFVYNFAEYSLDEISEIISRYSRDKGIFLDKSKTDLFAKYSRNNPRVAKKLFDRVLFIINRGYYKLSVKGIISALNDIGIYSGGYTDLDIQYLQALSKLMVSSLDNISRILKVDKNTILNEIEPFLIEKGHITITSKGRKFINFGGVNESGIH